MSSPDKYGRALWDDGMKSKLFDFIKQTTAQVKEAKLLDRKADGKSERTLDLYRRLSATRVTVTKDGAGRLMDGVTSASWHTTRAAVLHQLAEECRRWRSVADRSPDFNEAREAAMKARRAVMAFRDVSQMPKPPSQKPRQSKRVTLPRMKWQRIAFDAATKAQRPAVLVLWATGCRPAEIERGVTIKRTEGGGIVAEIIGAKVTEQNGQPHRRITIDPSSEPGRIISMMLGQKKGAVVKRRAKRIAADFADIRARSGLPSISAYSYRHQATSDMKARDDAPAKIAEALGHASERTQARYGSADRGHAGSAIVGAEAEREVRPGRSKMLDMLRRSDAEYE